MGALGFDPYAWLEREGLAVAKVANPANELLGPPKSFATFAAFAAPHLPREVVEGLSALPTARPPRGVVAADWAVIAQDALRLKDEGWASQALALGWSPLHLWGWCDMKDGLAVMLGGRRIVVLDAARALIDNGPLSTAVFNVRDMQDAKLLWELGR